MTTSPHSEPSNARWLRRPLVLAVIVFVALSGALGAAASVGLLPFLAGGPGNDSFTAAEAPAGDRLIGTTVGATADADEIAAGAGTAGQGIVWFAWTPSTTSWTYVVPTTVGGVVPGVRAFTGSSLDDLQRIDQPQTMGGPSGVTIPAVEGTTYFVAVAGDGGGAPFDLTLSQPGITWSIDDDGNPIDGSRSNDAPESAISVGFAPQAASASGEAETVTVDALAYAGAQPGEPGAGGQPAQHSLWYSWTAPAGNASVTFSAAPAFGATGDLRVAVYEGTGIDDLVAVGSTGSSASFVSQPDTYYLIQVDGPEIYFELTVTSTGVTGPDVQAPVVDCDAAPTGWSNAAIVGVACTATDAGSGLADPSDASFVLQVEVAEGVEDDGLVTAVRTVCDQAANCVEIGPFTGIKVDRRPPQVACSPVSMVWSSTAPTVTCQASDDGSGLVGDTDVSFSVAAPPDTEAEVEIPGGDICDQAGNCTTVGPFGPALVDTRAPVVECDAPPTGLQADEVTIECRASDASAGLADPTASEFSLSTSVGAGNVDPAAATDSLELCDLAGNCTTAGPFTGFDIDRAAPSVTCVPADGRDVDAWRTGPFSFSCTATDQGSGLAPPATGTFSLDATLPAGQESAEVATPGQTVCDLAGNCTTAGPFTNLRIDRLAPAVSCPAAGDGWLQGPGSVSCTATDGGSGLDPATSPVELVAAGSAGAEGSVSTGSAEVCDLAGNCAVAGPVSNVLIDRKAPVVSCATPAPLYKVEARITCTATDGGAGLAAAELASFTLVTSVGAGNVDASATTDTREVCDAVENCTTAGPFTVNVDLTDLAPGNGPDLSLPGRITIVSTITPAGPTPAPYELPASPDADLVECRPEPGTVVNLGWTTVVCEAVWPLGTTVGSFPLVTKPLPELASGAIATPGGAWRAVGVGYEPGSDVRVTIGDRLVATGTAGADGRVALGYDLPADLPSGAHLQVVRGVDGTGNPLLTVGPLSAVAAPPGEEPPTEPPPGAPELPPSGPALPPDPGPEPIDPVGGPTTTSTTSTTKPPLECDFTDVPATHPFFDEIYWLANNRITTGYPDCTFRPSLAITRQAMAAFLYRWAGSPVVPDSAPTFTDVPSTSPFYNAIRWLADEGYSTGFADGTFKPGNLISRQAMAAFLHRIAGEPPVPAGSPNFTDVPADHPFRTAIRWLAGVGITNGYADGTFRPTDSVTRQAMAAFLFRYEDKFGTLDSATTASGPSDLVTNPLRALTSEPAGQATLLLLLVGLLSFTVARRRRSAQR